MYGLGIVLFLTEAGKEEGGERFRRRKNKRRRSSGSVGDKRKCRGPHFWEKQEIVIEPSTCRTQSNAWEIRDGVCT